jgi:pimeloyl-ACP methyl ester carboxylesterase
VGDAQLYYEVADFTDPWKSADTILLHHSAFATMRRYYAWVPLLSRHFKVVRFDIRGHGDSSAVPEDYQWSIDVLAGDVARLMDHLGVDRFHYVGSSAGGYIGIRFASSYPERVKTLSLVATSAIAAETKANFAEWVATIKAEGVDGFLRKDIANRFNPGTDPGFLEWYLQEAGRLKPYAAAGFAAHMTSLDQRSLLPRIQCPTLIIGAGASDISLPSSQYYMTEHIPDAELIMYEGMKHNIMWAVPDRCAADVLAFLERRGFLKRG